MLWARLIFFLSRSSITGALCICGCSGCGHFVDSNQLCPCQKDWEGLRNDDVIQRCEGEAHRRNAEGHETNQGSCMGTLLHCCSTPPPPLPFSQPFLNIICKVLGLHIVKHNFSFNFFPIFQGISLEHCPQIQIPLPVDVVIMHDDFLNSFGFTSQEFRDFFVRCFGSFYCS